MAVQAKNEQVREEGLEDSQGDSTLFQDSSFKSLISVVVPGPDTQDNPNLPVGDSLETMWYATQARDWGT